MNKNNPVNDFWTKAKAWYKSKTIFGVLIMIATTALGFFFPEKSIDISGGVDVIIEAGDTAVEGINQIWILAGQAVGAIVAIYGRFKAKIGLK